ncbi:MAG: L,D-transpeptidase family protein [Candidatus Pacebacteria bacterium]|nr:L,D-transpeptidase family protein [Candidatus Paceibacterota bacterium]
MKKFKFYILILIALVGLLGSTVRIDAQSSFCPQATQSDPTGQCDYGPGANGQDYIENTTESDCAPQLATGDAKSFTPDTYGDCTINGATQQCTTRASCDQSLQTPGNNGSFTGYYNLLAPLPQVGPLFDANTNTAQPNSLGRYLNPMITVFIGICGVLAVIMILMGGIEYMTSELVSSKEAGKERIRNALFGLILALGAWTILHTINPDILNSDPSIPNANITTMDAADQATLANSEQTTSSVGTGYKTNAPDAGVAAFAQNNCSSLSSIGVDTTNQTAAFCAGLTCVTVPINIGYKGVAQPGTATDGDAKTPVGTYKLGSKTVGSNGSAVISNGYNFGAAFVNIGVTDSNGVNRGIGFHGNAGDTLGTTNGCVRMTNDDLALLAPCMQQGTTVVIQ